MIAIIDYRAGNLTSVRLACDSLGLPAEITSDPARIAAAERVIFPGVGAIGSAMRTINELGLGATIRDVVDAGTPFLGICLGTQIIFAHSAEDGGVDGLGLLPGNVLPFTPSSPYDKVPQMGWNAVTQQQAHPLFTGIESGAEFYFVHSYYPMPTDPDLIIGTTDYADVTFAAAVARDNLVATQFHPEKSGRIGLKLLQNFAHWTGTPR